MASYPTRKIGDMDVSAIGLGLMWIGANANGTRTDEDTFKLMNAAIERGCNFWDTADRYGDSEILIGKWFKYSGKRDKVIISTKGGTTGGASGVNGEPEFLRAALEKSLERLGVESIDLYYLHRADPTVPIERSMGALASFVKEGKIKYIGLSEVSADTLRRAHAVHPIAAVQTEYSPFTLDIEYDKHALLKTCRELGVKVVAYGPLGKGLLTGQIKSPNDVDEGDIRRRVGFPRFRDENILKTIALVEKIRDIGVKYNATPGQVSLAWLLAQGEDIIPIPGTTKIKYLEENFAAGHIKLSPEDEKAVRALAEEADGKLGARYPPGFSDLLFVDTPAL